MSSRPVQTILYVMAIAVMLVPFSCQNVRSAESVEETTTYNLYFGDLHTHTSYSDGTGTPWEAFQAAIDADADFMAITDHIAIWHAYHAWVADEEEWLDLLAAADHFTSGEFVAMAAYEAWLLADLGEFNVYNTREMPEGPLGNRKARLPNFYDWVASQPGAVAQFNHPTYVSDNFEDFSYYTEARDLGVGVLENFDDANTEASYIMALDAGWHVMPAANSDTHYDNWMTGSEVRAVLLAPSLTPENLYDAMRNSRGYATQDKNLEIRYSVNGAVMGSVLSPTGSYQLSVSVYDPDGAVDAVRLVEVVSDGGEVVASMAADSASVEWTVTLTSDSAHYFYLRVTTASSLLGVEGVTAWTAPVWIER